MEEMTKTETVHSFKNLICCFLNNNLVKDSISFLTDKLNENGITSCAVKNSLK